MKSLWIGAAALSLCVSAANATSLGNLYTGYFALGDSLSDPGNLFEATGGANPAPPYVDGRFSNGPVFTEVIGQHFDDVSNFAFGGAQAVNPMTGPLPLHLDAQLQLLGAEALEGNVSGSLVTLLMGANDIFGALGAVAATQPEDPVTPVVSTAAAAAAAVSSAVSTIVNYLPAEIVVIGLPDIGTTPAYATTPLAPLATLASDTFNAALSGITGLSTPTTQVSYFDLDGFLDGLTSDPTRFGLSPSLLGVPCFTPGLDAAPECEGFLFVDGVHPTTGVHAAFASQLEATLLGETATPTPVPLPAGLPLLAMGLGGLVLIRKGRRAA